MQQAAAVVEDRTGDHRTRLPIDHAADALDASRLFVGGVVVELQGHLRHVFQRLLHRAILPGERQQLVLCHGEIDIHGGIVGDRRQGLRQGRTYQSTHPIGQGIHHAVARCLHLRIGEVIASVHLLRLRLCHLRLGAPSRLRLHRAVRFFPVLGDRSQYLAALGSWLSRIPKGSCRWSPPSSFDNLQWWASVVPLCNWPTAKFLLPIGSNCALFASSCSYLFIT